jgi:hypothetical protein
MLTSTRSQSEAQKKPGIPNWVGPVVMVACIVGVGWFIWWYLFGSLPSNRMVTVDPAEVQRESMRGAVRPLVNRVQQPPGPGIRKTGDAEWLVNGTNSAIQVRKQKDRYRLRPFFHRSAVISVQDYPLLIAQARLKNDDAMAKQLGVTPEQVKTLRQIDVLTMKVSDKDLADAETKFDGYAKAARGEAQKLEEKKVIDALEAMAKVSLVESKQAATEGMATIKQIITPQRLVKLAGK